MGWSHAEQIFDPVSDYTLQAVWGGGHCTSVQGVGVFTPVLTGGGPSRAAGQYRVWPRVTTARAHCWPLARWPVLCPAARRIGFTELIFRLTSGSQRGNIRQQPLSSMIHSQWE